MLSQYTNRSLGTAGHGYDYQMTPQQLHQRRQLFNLFRENLEWPDGSLCSPDSDALLGRWVVLYWNDHARRRLGEQ